MPHLGEFTKATAIAQKFARIKTGTYTGDDTTSQAIEGVGFTPKMVWIIPHLTAEGNSGVYCKTDGMYGDLSIEFYAGIGGKIYNNKLISLDSDGFTVDDDGTNSDPNKLDQVYDYVAFG